MKNFINNCNLSKAEVFVNSKDLLKKQIHYTELQIKRLQANSNSTDICEDLYNSLILKKAVLKKQLENLNRNPIIEGVKRLVPRKEKLICDYFS
jgi:hypothetical protein